MCIEQTDHSLLITEAMNMKSAWSANGVNQICEFADQKNSLQSVNHNLHVAPGGQ